MLPWLPSTGARAYASCVNDVHGVAIVTGASRGIGAGLVAGYLLGRTRKGITKTVTFPATISLACDTANVDAEFAINRRDFSLNYPGKPNDLIRDDVVIKLTIRAKRAS